MCWGDGEYSTTSGVSRSRRSIWIFWIQGQLKYHSAILITLYFEVTNACPVSQLIMKVHDLFQVICAINKIDYYFCFYHLISFFNWAHNKPSLPKYVQTKCHLFTLYASRNNKDFWLRDCVYMLGTLLLVDLWSHCINTCVALQLVLFLCFCKFDRRVAWWWQWTEYIGQWSEVTYNRGLSNCY